MIRTKTWLKVLVLLAVTCGASTFATEGAVVTESARTIPVACEVDVLVVGGSTAAVAAARQAAREGASVFLAAPRPYLGEDVCGPGRLCLEGGQAPGHPTAKELFRSDRWTRPMEVKRVLDQALLDAGVKFLYGCYVTEVLREESGKPAGIEMVNLSGRQAVVAKVVIDATHRAVVARRAGASFRPYPSGPQTFRRVVIGGGGAPAKDAVVRKLSVTAPGRPRKRGGEKRAYPIYVYTLNIAMGGGGYTDFMDAEHKARDATWDPKQVDASEFLFQVPPDAVCGRKSLSGDWPGPDRVDLHVFRPKGIERLYVLGGCADVPRELAESLLQPGELMEAGARVGAAAATEARSMGKPEGVQPPEIAGQATERGDVREPLAGLRRGDADSLKIPCPRRALPVLGRYDVVVVGGGTSGAPAAIGAAGRGATTLVVEYQYGLGGVGTIGLIGNYYYGYRKGFTAEVIQGVKAIGADVLPLGRMEYWRRECRKAGADVWLGALGCGAFVEGRRVKGVVVATPEGRGVVLAKVVIDSTGKADIAAAAGAQCVGTGARHIEVQGAGLSPRGLGRDHSNSDWATADGTDVVDVWNLFVLAKRRYKSAYDLSQLLDTRERRRIVGDFEVSPLDIVGRRTYPDTVVRSFSYFDSHGLLSHPLFLVAPSAKGRAYAYTPFRCLTPKGLEGVLVTGLGISAHRDAMALLRMQPDLQNQGYAAGVAAAMAAEADGSVRQINIKDLQTHLVEKGNLPESVLGANDSYPIPKEHIEAIVRSLVEGKDTAAPHTAKILAHPESAIPFLRQAYKEAATEEQKLKCARVLGILGDNTGVETLIARVASVEGLDEGRRFRTWGGMSLSPLDRLIIALGYTRDSRAVAPILDKLSVLDRRSEYSHVHSVALALEMLGDPAAAEPLARLLTNERHRMSGHTITRADDTHRWASRGAIRSAKRMPALREIILARALYRCGDYQGIARRILTAYTNDLRGHLARHARAVLAAEPE